MKEKEFNFEVKERIEVISKNRSTTKELNLISFDGKEPKYDLRVWINGNMGKGITFTGEELIRLRECLTRIEIETEG